MGKHLVINLGAIIDTSLLMRCAAVGCFVMMFVLAPDLNGDGGDIRRAWQNIRYTFDWAKLLTINWAVCLFRAVFPMFAYRACISGCHWVCECLDSFVRTIRVCACNNHITDKMILSRSNQVSFSLCKLMQIVLCSFLSCVILKESPIFKHSSDFVCVWPALDLSVTFRAEITNKFQCSKTGNSLETTYQPISACVSCKITTESSSGCHI